MFSLSQNFINIIRKGNRIYYQIIKKEKKTSKHQSTSIKVHVETKINKTSPKWSTRLKLSKTENDLIRIGCYRNLKQKGNKGNKKGEPSLLHQN